MKTKFKFKKNYLVKFIVVFAFILFIYSFIYLMNNTQIKDMFINEYLFKLDDNKTKITKSKLVYSSLNKIVDYDEANIDLNDITDTTIDEDEEEVITSPLVYIYNSHQTEEYFMPYVSDNSIKPTVLFASYILKDYLNDIDISSVVENKSMKEYLVNNSLEYKDSYEASRYYINEKLKEYSSIKYLIDIHRDSSKINKTLYEKDGKRYARVMFVVGFNHEEYEKNFKFVKKLNEYLNKNYKGISRGIYERKDARFNQDILETAVLIELGGVDNTIEEVNNTCLVLAEMFKKFIGE